MKPIGSAIRTYTGALFDFEHPEKSPISIEDIAHSLSLLCRFAGHSKKFYCVTPETKILTSDLRWIPAGSLNLGDMLFGFDEDSDKGSTNPRVNRRRLRPAKVLHTGVIKRPVYTLVLSDGTHLSASEDHPWLMATKKARNQKWKTAKQIYIDVKNGTFKHPRASQYMLRFLYPWKEDKSYEGGYASGIFDGEGYISFHSGKALSLGFGQNPGIVLNKISKYLKDKNFKIDKKKHPDSKCIANVVRGGWTETLRLLGTIRPQRLLDKFESNFLTNKYDRQFPSVELLQIVDVIFEGEKEVIALETSTHTYFAEGFGAHNSVAEHSVRVSYLVSPEHALWGLMHDASECYCVDVPRPLKHMDGMKVYRDHEKRVMKAICAWFNMDSVEPPEVKAADNVMLVTEQRDLLNNSIPDFNIEPLVGPIYPVSSKQAERAFLRRFYELTKIKN